MCMNIEEVQKKHQTSEQKIQIARIRKIVSKRHVTSDTKTVNKLHQ